MILEFISKTTGKKLGHTTDIRKVSRVDGSQHKIMLRVFEGVVH